MDDSPNNQKPTATNGKETDMAKGNSAESGGGGISIRIDVPSKRIADLEKQLREERQINETLAEQFDGVRDERDRFRRDLDALKNARRSNPDTPEHCDGCRHLNMTEDEQNQYPDPRPGHMCQRAGRFVYHAGEHPRIGRPYWCPGFELYNMPLEENTGPDPSAPFLTAKHPKTDGWRRWRFDNFGDPAEADFYLSANRPGIVLMRGFGPWNLGPRWILREAGPYKEPTHTDAEWRRLHKRLEKNRELRERIKHLESQLIGREEQCAPNPTAKCQGNRIARISGTIIREENKGIRNFECCGYAAPAVGDLCLGTFGHIYRATECDVDTLKRSGWLRVILRDAGPATAPETPYAQAEDQIPSTLNVERIKLSHTASERLRREYGYFVRVGIRSPKVGEWYLGGNGTADFLLLDWGLGMPEMTILLPAEGPAEKRKEPKPEQIRVHEDNGGGKQWFIREPKPRVPNQGEWFHDPREFPCARKLPPPWRHQHKVFILHPVESPAERIQLAGTSDAPVFRWFVREKQYREATAGEWFLLAGMKQAVQASAIVPGEIPVLILHPVEGPEGERG